MNPKKPTPIYIIIKMSKVKDKERILKAAREKQLVTYKGTPIRLSADFSTETLQTKRDWHKIFKIFKVPLNDTIGQMDLIDILRTFHRKQQNIHSFQVHMQYLPG